jgi:general secretion pathway protein A
MYKSFYNLNRNPFDLTPDPACFVPTVRHNEALAALYYGIRKHKGVVVITGEVGTGKTLLVRCLLRLFKESSEISYSYLFNCRLSATEFLFYVAADFGIPLSGETKSKLLIDLSKYVSSRGLKGLTTVLIIDEAHNLSMDLLEEIRLLSNLETNEDKLLQIVLIGQPELDEKLDSYDLRPLKQRIALRAHLSALDHSETERYISERLDISGRPQHLPPLFSPEAIAAAYRYSRGFPRVINTLCENALITAYARRMATVTAAIIEDVAKDFRLDLEARGSNGRISGEGDLDIDDDAKDFFLDPYSAMKRPLRRDESDKPIAIKAGEHEPDI